MTTKDAIKTISTIDRIDKSLCKAISGATINSSMALDIESLRYIAEDYKRYLLNTELKR